MTWWAVEDRSGVVAQEEDAQPVGGPGGSWDLIFEDQFSSLDLSVWRPNWLGTNDSQITKPMLNPTYARSSADPSKITFAGGIMTHHLTEGTSTVTGGPDVGTEYDYAGTGMTTNPSHGGGFSFTGGYVEFRARLATQDETWPGLWLFNLGPGDVWSGGEIDVMESGMTDADVAHGSIDPDPGTAEFSVASATIASHTTTWHTYAVHWEPGARVRWYYDGVLEGTWTTNVPNVPMALMIDIGVFDFPGGTVPSGSDQFDVDYVRVWQ